MKEFSRDLHKKQQNNSTSDTCWLCELNHSILYCEQFKSLSIKQRREETAKKRVWFNCLKIGHTATICKNPRRCKLCSQSHSEILHLGPPTQTVLHVNKDKDFEFQDQDNCNQYDQ